MRQLIFLTLLIPALASAKCVYQEFTFSGLVKDKTGTPVPALPLRLEWRQGYGTEESVSTVSGSAGEFNFNIQFNTHSGMSLLGNHRCKSKLETVTFKLGNEGAQESQIVKVSGSANNLELIYGFGGRQAPNKRL